jgi:hypothetical protein
VRETVRLAFSPPLDARGLDAVFAKAVTEQRRFRDMMVRGVQVLLGSPS